MNYNPNMFEVGDKVMAKIYGVDYDDPQVEYEGIVTIREIYNGYIYFNETVWNAHPCFDYVRNLTKLEKALR